MLIVDKIPIQAVNMVVKFEGYHARAYYDNGGWSIGYGHWSKIRPIRLMDKKRARLMLASDLELVQKRIIESAPTIKLNKNELSALDDFAYNVGISAYLHSTLRKLLSANKLYAASKQFSRWVYSGHRKSKGLIIRRAAEMKLFDKK